MITMLDSPGGHSKLAYLAKNHHTYKDRYIKTATLMMQFVYDYIIHLNGFTYKQFADAFPFNLFVRKCTPVCLINLYNYLLCYSVCVLGYVTTLNRLEDHRPSVLVL